MYPRYLQAYAANRQAQIDSDRNPIHFIGQDSIMVDNGIAVSPQYTPKWKVPDSLIMRNAFFTLLIPINNPSGGYTFEYSLMGSIDGGNWVSVAGDTVVNNYFYSKKLTNLNMNMFYINILQAGVWSPPGTISPSPFTYTARITAAGA
jgi:hypothetical protein